jgi:NAD+ synthase
MKFALAQINSIVGALKYNQQKIIKSYQQSIAKNVDLVIFPELAISGYPPEDLLLKQAFLDDNLATLQDIIEQSKGQKTAMLLGALWQEAGLLYNAAVFIEDGSIKQIFKKIFLPNFGVFDEKRYFVAGERVGILDFKGQKIAVLICEDLWNCNVSEVQEADILAVLNSSPFTLDKYQRRLGIASRFAKKMLYVNQVGGHDSLVFDGKSFVLGEQGELLEQAKGFAEDLLVTDFTEKANQPVTDQIEDIYNALMLGLRDYVTKNGFKSVLIGFSAGVDSVLVSMVAIDVLGAENVHLVTMPSEFTSKETFADAEDFLAKSGACNIQNLPIESLFSELKNNLAASFVGLEDDVTEENMQARIRGLLLMSLSNKFNHLVLATSNKSESAVGYATLYGDMCGAFSLIKDVYKTELYKLANWRNHNFPVGALGNKGMVIPQNIIKKEPTAELRHNQRDADSLPPYEILDKILFLLIEKQLSVKEIIVRGFDSEVVAKVAKLLKNSEYKRKQAPLGVKITNMSFDKDRRYPITNHYDS